MPFQIIQPDHQELIHQLVSRSAADKIPNISADLADLIDRIRTDIPEKRRVSIGRYSIIKDLGDCLYPLLSGSRISPLKVAVQIYGDPDFDPFVRALGLKLMARYAQETNQLSTVLSYFKTAADDEDWILRECASGLIRPLIKAYPDTIRAWYLDLVGSKAPNLRRLVSESLRPVVENRWFHKQPGFALDILGHLFQETDPYPRTSVGNNLSDWMRVDPETAWPLVVKLASSGGKNSYWIAYRACRNYVKKEPVLVMETLGVEEYKYKNRHFKLAEYQE